MQNGPKIFWILPGLIAMAGSNKTLMHRKLHFNVDG
jgi:hypothetical protein